MTFLAPARFMLLAGLVGSLRRGGAEADVRPPHFRLPHFRRAVTAGSTMTAAAQRACSEALGAPVAQSFGCTEVLLVSGDHGQPPRYGSAGKLVPGVRARVGSPTRASNNIRPAKKDVSAIEKDGPYAFVGGGGPNVNVAVLHANVDFRGTYNRIAPML